MASTKTRIQIFKKEKAVKAIVSVWVVLIMAFALVSIGEVGTGSSYNDNLAAVVVTHNGAGDADNPGYFPEGSPYSCGIESPAYLDYTDARAVPCDQDRSQSRSMRTPDPMGSPGF